MRRYGFTLVELLVVVAIIAGLVGLMSSSLKQAQDMAKSIQCASMQRQLAMANHAYADDFANIFVPIYLMGDAGDYNRIQWWRNLAFVTRLGVVGRPSIGTFSSGTQYQYLNLPEKFLCPKLPLKFVSSNARQGRCYAMNWCGVNDVTWYETSITVRRQSVKVPASTVQICDANDWHIFNPETANPVYWEATGELRPEEGGVSHQQVTYRHMDGANVAYYDGHCEWLSKAQMYKGPTSTGVNDMLWKVYR